MRLESLAIRDMGPFGEFSVDLSDHPGPLVAFTGPNGAGKSTALELALPGALYRDCPTRGSLTALATSRAASLSVRLVHAGKTWTINHAADKVSGKSEAVVLDSNGSSVLPSSKVRDFDAWAARALPPPEVLFASVFASQGTAGFLGMREGDRKAVLLRVLGVERLESMAETARARGRAVSADVAVVRALLTEAEKIAAIATDVPAAVESLATANAAALDATNALRSATEDRARRLDLDAKRADLSRRFSEVFSRVQTSRAATERAAEIRAAVEETAALQAGIAERETEHADMRRQREVWEAKRAAAERVTVSAVAQVDRLLAQWSASDGECERELAALLPERRAAMDSAMAQRAAAERAIEEAHSTVAAAASCRIDRLRGALVDVTRARSGAAKIAHDAIWRDDAALDTIESLPFRLAALQSRSWAAADDACDAEVALRSAEIAESKLPAIARLEADLREAQRVAAVAQCAENAVEAESPDIVEEERLGVSIAEHRSAIATRADLVAMAGALTSAEAVLNEMEPLAHALSSELVSVDKLLGSMPFLDLAPFSAAASRAVAARDAATEALGRERARDAQRVAAETIVAERTAELATLSDELSDWNRLAADLGRDGIQAAEIDAAGPELTELTNDLLHTCHGPRWTVRVDTQRLSADGKRMIEGCAVNVVDTVAGREAEGSTFSGGERVLIGDALSLAITMLACRRAGLDRPTLVRDESGAALDPSNARVYVAMLRRAAQLVDADKVLFVSHDPEVTALADSIVEVSR